MCIKLSKGRSLFSIGNIEISKDLLFYYIDEVKRYNPRLEQQSREIKNLLSRLEYAPIDCSVKDLIQIIDWADFDSKISQSAIQRGLELARNEKEEEDILAAKERAREEKQKQVHHEYALLMRKGNSLALIFAKFKLCSLSSSFERKDMRQIILDAADIVISYLLTREENLTLETLVKLYNILPIKNSSTDEKLENIIIDTIEKKKLTHDYVFGVLEKTENPFSETFKTRIELLGILPSPSIN